MSKQVRQPRYRYFDAIYNGDKVPRKEKKYFLGPKLSGSELRRLLNTVKITLYKDPERPSYPIVKFSPYSFCPKCGCQNYRSVYHSVSYPEVWNDYRCLRCGTLVAYEDNSPFIHVLEEMLNDDYERQMADKENMPIYEYQTHEVNFDIDSL